MRTVELEQATAPLADYARRARKEGVVVTLRGRPLATVTAVPKDADWESLAVAMDSKFQAIIERSRKAHREQGGISPDEMRRHLGMVLKRRVRTKRRARRP